MSRVGKRPIPVPQGVDITFNGNEVVVKGPKGTLSRSFHPDMIFNLEDGVLTVARPTDNKQHRSLHGLTRTLTANMVQGVSEGFQKVLDIVGVGYRAQLAGNKLTLQLGYSHPVEITAPEGITFQVEGTNKIIVSGINREQVGEVGLSCPRWTRRPRPAFAELLLLDPLPSRPPLTPSLVYGAGSQTKGSPH